MFQYLQSFKARMSVLNATEAETEELAQKIDNIYLKVKENNKQFLNSTQFAKTMEVFTKDNSEMPSKEDLVRNHSDLMIELFRFTQKTDKKTATKVKDRAKKIKALTDTIKKLQAQIYEAENEELDFDALDSESSFTDLPKLYRKVHEVWIKREELLKRSTYTGRVMFKKYKCDSTPYPEINKCVESLFNSHLKKIKNRTTKGYVDESFTFIDVRKEIMNVIKEKQLAVMNCESMIETIYKDLLNEKRLRRQKDSEEMFETLETLQDLKPETFVKDDPLIELQLVKNKNTYDRRMDELIEKYTKEDRKMNGESILKDGLSEWETDGLVNNDEAFESLDIKDGDLEEDNNTNDEESDDDIELSAAPIPDFKTTETNGEASQTKETTPSDEMTATVEEKPIKRVSIQTVSKSVPITTEPEILINGDNSSDDVIIIS